MMRIGSVVREKRKARRWQEAEQGKRARGNRDQVKTAVPFGEETLVTPAWTVAPLGMGTAGHVKNRRNRWRNGTPGMKGE